MFFVGAPKPQLADFLGTILKTYDRMNHRDLKTVLYEYYTLQRENHAVADVSLRLLLGFTSV